MTKGHGNSIVAYSRQLRLAVLWLMFFASATHSCAIEPSAPLRRSRQCIIVITDNWTDSVGTLYWFERENSTWQRRGGPTPVVVGRAGLAWGRGEADVSHQSGPVKREGDDKAPAGVFKLGTAFGYAFNPVATKIPYLALTKNVVAVDDPQSRYYNQLLDKTKVTAPDWRTAENMVLADNRYKWGVFVQHNIPPVPGAGSCIFLHCWKDSRTLTSGCSAIAEENLLKILRWLDPERHPLLVQLPRSLYNEVRAKWDLPSLTHK